MAFFNSAVGVLQTLVVALGAGLGIWGAINLLEGYGNDNPGAKSQGMKQLMAGGGVAFPACSADQAGKGCGIRPASYIVGDILEKTIILTRIENRIGRAMS